MPEITIRTDATPDPSKAPANVVEKKPGEVQVVPPAEGGDPQRPAWLPEKFKSAEDLAKAYAELEKKQSQPAPKPQEKPAGQTTEQLVESAQKAGVDLKALGDEFAKNGKLSDTSYKALADKGFTKESVDSYIAGQQALATQTRTELVESVGGEETFGKMIEWAKAALSPEDQVAYNSAVESGNKALAKMALEGLHARYTAAVGSEPELINGEAAAASSGVKGYESQAQIIAAMSDPRYATDDAYRRSVEQRMAKTDVNWRWNG